MEAPHSDITEIKLKFFFALTLHTGPPPVLLNGPTGSRYCVPILGGSFQGGPGYEDFHGTVEQPASDWAKASSILNIHVACYHLFPNSYSYS